MEAQQANAFVRALRKVYNPIGFKKGYNALLWFTCSGYFLGFLLARLMYYNYYGIFCGKNNPQGTGAAPGECYYYLRGHYKIGMMLHLFTIFPAAILALLQFVPLVRYKAMWFHRVNGYFVSLLVFVSVAGALMVARVSFGGGLAIQSAVGFLAIISVTSIILAWVNIKRLQIDQHRAWMLRAWVYMGSIITTRLVMIIAARVISAVGTYYSARPCAQIAFIYSNDKYETIARYPECAAYFNGTNPTQHVVVHLLFGAAASREQIGTILGESFATGLWVAIALHAIGVEVYLRLTPREHERLRQVSWQRQVEAGMKHAGSAGLTVDRFGDAEPWKPSKPSRASGGRASDDGSASIAITEEAK